MSAMNSPTQLLTDKEGSLEECVRPNWTYMDAFRRVSPRSLDLPSGGEISELLSVLLTFGHTSENLLGLLRMSSTQCRAVKSVKRTTYATSAEARQCGTTNALPKNTRLNETERR
jgi:hypothetical protein